MSEVTIKLDGDEVTLRCTPLALKTICLKHGDPVAAHRKLQSLDFLAAVDVVAAGIGPKALKEMKINQEGLEKAVYDAGLIELTAPLMRFVNMLANGGKEPGGESDGEGGDEGNG